MSRLQVLSARQGFQLHRTKIRASPVNLDFFQPPWSESEVQRLLSVFFFLSLSRKWVGAIWWVAAILRMKAGRALKQRPGGCYITHDETRKEGERFPAAQSPWTFPHPTQLSLLLSPFLSLSLSHSLIPTHAHNHMLPPTSLLCRFLSECSLR